MPIASSCFSPKYGNCQIRCVTDEACPEGLSCSSGFCTYRGSRACSGSSSEPDAATAGALSSAGSAGATHDVGEGGAVSGWTDASVDASEAEAPPSVCPSDVFSCDGFEGNELDAKWSKEESTPGGVSIDTERTYRGTSSLRLHIKGDNVAGASIGTIATFRKNPLHIRFFLFIPENTPRLEMIIALAVQDRRELPFFQLRLFEDHTLGQTTLGFQPELRFGRDTSRSAKLNAFNCIEWKLQVPDESHPQGEARVWLEDQELVQAANFDPIRGIPFDALSVGIVDARRNPIVPEVELWLDEVIVDDKPIGCAR